MADRVGPVHRSLSDLVDPDPRINANLYGGDSTIGSPYYRTVGGGLENPENPYGAFD